MNRGYINRTFHTPPTFTTERLIFRPLSRSDRKDMYEYASDPEVTKYLTWKPHMSISYTGRYLKSVEQSYKDGRFYDWGLELRAGGKMIGTCGFTSFDYFANGCEIGYVINPRYHGYSLATEAACAAISFAFNRLGASFVTARCMPGNTASRRVMEKCGMVFRGKQFDTVIKDNEFIEVHEYIIYRKN